MAAVASGRYDAYLRSYANAVRAYGHPIVIGFAAEMNGDWDPWGGPQYACGHLDTRVASCR